MIRPKILSEILSYNSQWLIEQMSEDGRFLYQYEKRNDNYVISEASENTQQSYYNIVRHSGSTIILLRSYEYLKDEKLLAAAKKSISYFISTLEEKEIDSMKTFFPVYNQKSKLGAAGLGLASLIHYYRLSNDQQYREIIDGIVQHILSRISDEGELISYYLHPLINNGKPIDFKFISELNEEQKSKLYSYYFPGEALLGLALYYQNINDIPPELEQTIVQKSLLALDYIIKRHSNKKTNELHSIDIWAMQAIEEFAKNTKFNKPEYIRFVFDQSNQFLEDLIEEENILISEYVDASCCEGLIASYCLAKYLKRNEQSNYMMSKLLQISEEMLAQELLSPEKNVISLNNHFDSKQCLENFYCKLKHQSINMDLIHHLMSFISRLLMSNFDKLELDNVPIEIIDDYQLVQTIYTGELTKVFLGYHLLNTTKSVAIKKIACLNNESLIKQEAKVFSLFQTKFKGVQNSFVYEQFHSNNYFSKNCFSKNYAFFISHFYNKGNLYQYLDNKEILNEKLTIQFLEEMLIIFKQMEQNCLLHLNINPENVLVSADNEGFHFNLCGWSQSQFASFVRIDKFDKINLYLPPEYYKGYLTSSSDIYALGAVIYFILEGKHAFNLDENSSPAQIIYSHYLLDLDFSNHTPQKLQYLIIRMMDKNQRSRANIEEVEEIIKSHESFEIEKEINTTLPSNSLPSNILPSNNDQDLWELLAEKIAEKNIPHAFKNFKSPLTPLC